MASTKPTAKTATKPAPAAKSTKPKPSTSRALGNWDEELAAQAAQAAKTEESTATGSFFSTKSGVLALNDSPMLGNQMAVVITDSIMENVFYGSDYDPDEPKGPLCFAFGRSEDEMAPHQVCVDAGTAVSESCADCPNNEWGSADKGKGKACRNIRRLALVSAGTLDKNDNFEEDLKNVADQANTFMKLPVTSVKGYSAYVKSLAASLKRPPHGVVSHIRVVPDAKSQFKVTFEALGTVDNSAMGDVMAKHKEAMALIEQPYQPYEEQEQERKPASRGKVPAKSAGGRRKF